MYTSAIEIRKDTDSAKKTVRVYLLASLFVMVFGQIYEHFSYGVYSRAMFWAFLIPLFLGAAAFRLLTLLRVHVMPSDIEAVMYHCGVATLTVGSLFKGILDIYGTESGLMSVYYAAGTGLAAAGAAAYLYRIVKNQ